MRGNIGCIHVRGAVRIRHVKHAGGDGRITRTAWRIAHEGRDRTASRPRDAEPELRLRAEAGDDLVRGQGFAGEKLGVRHAEVLKRERRGDAELSVDRRVVPDRVEVAVRNRRAARDRRGARDQSGDLANVLISGRRYEQRISVDQVAGARSVHREGKSKRAATYGQRKTARVGNAHRKVPPSPTIEDPGAGRDHG